MILGIYCSGSLGQEVYNLIVIGQIENSWEEVLFIDDMDYEKKQGSARIFPFEQIKREFSADEIEIAIATGEPYYRGQIYNKVKKTGYKLATLISKNSIYGSGTLFEEGCILFPSCYVGNGVILKSNVVIHVGAKVESGCHIGAHSFISLGAFVGADTRLGERVFIGPNAALKDHIAVNRDSVIGMGAVLVEPVDECQVYVGNPAHYLRMNGSHKLFSHSIVDEGLF